MERRTPVYVVCSPRPRVGKTLIARLLTEFVIADGRPAAAFDVNPDDFTLADQLPRHTAIANIGDTRGQMALFDELISDDETAKIVDLGAASFERFFAVLQEIAFIQEARYRSIQPVILFLTDPDRRSIQAYANLQSRLPQAVLVPVHNEAIAREQQARGHFPAQHAGSVPVRIPQLPPFLKAIIDKPGFSFNAFLQRSADAETGLRAWIKRIYIEFRELELRLLLEELKSNLQFQL